MRPATPRLACVLLASLALASCGTAPQGATGVPSLAPAAASASLAPAVSASLLASGAPPTPSDGTATASGPASACVAATTPASADWNQRTWYEAFVRSFADSDGDGVGDLKGLTGKLDYLNDGDPATTADLGITGIWLMPVFTAASYHGYDVVDYRTIDPAYGTAADFAAFGAAAHRRGIKVILDLVMNHTSDQNPWFKASAARDPRYADWYVWADADPGYLGPQGQTVWHPLNGRWYYGVFGAGMPDLNLRNPAVTAELESIAASWLGQGVDGFRLDAIPYLIEDGQKQFSTPETRAWLASFQASLKAAFPTAMTIGEVWAGASVAAKYVPDDTDLTFDFDLAAATLSSVHVGQPASLTSALSQTTASWPANQEGTFLTNHDQDRVMTQLGGRTDEAKLAALLLMAEPGVPFVYYGEELGLTGSKPDEQIRTPMPWTADPSHGGFTTGTPWEPLAEGTASTNVAVESADPGSLLSTYRALIRVRDAQPALRVGRTLPVEATGPVAAWIRATPDDVELVVANTSDAPTSDYALSLDAGPLCGARTTATVAAAVNLDAGEVVVAPAATATGGFDGYRPIATLPAHAGVVIDLGSP